MKTLILATTASLTLWGGSAYAQNLAMPAVSGDASVVQANWRGKRRGGRGAMMQILRAADADGDNALTQAELDAYVAQQTTAADANGDGDITLAEFDAIWKDFTKRQKVRAFQALDADASGTITAAERTERFGNVVSRMDRNGDGKLDRSDRRGRRGDRN